MYTSDILWDVNSRCARRVKSAGDFSCCWSALELSADYLNNAAAILFKGLGSVSIRLPASITFFLKAGILKNDRFGASAIQTLVRKFENAYNLFPYPFQRSQKEMRTFMRTGGTLMALFAMVMLTGCVAGPAGPYYSVQEQPAVQPAGPAPPPGPPPSNLLTVGPRDRIYTMRIDDRTPFGLRNLPATRQMLYQKGYDQARRDREADFEIDLVFDPSARDNPQQRAEHVVGGALLGAATGAIIGGALGAPGRGAAIGAGSGAALGLVAPAGAAMVRIDIRTQSFRDGISSFRSALVDLANVPPGDVQRVIDTQVSRMVDSLPTR